MYHIYIYVCVYAHTQFITVFRKVYRVDKPTHDWEAPCRNDWADALKHHGKNEASTNEHLLKGYELHNYHIYHI